MRTRQYMIDIAGGTGNVLTHHKTIQDLEKYFGGMVDNKDVKEFLKKVISDTEGQVFQIDIIRSNIIIVDFYRILHLFPWSGIINEDCQLSETFRVPDPMTGQMRRLISQISHKEEEMFRNMIRRLNNIVKVP